ncbi:MAG TPA: hypothetical protein VGV14_07375, partial [Rhodanobacter sp.]|nr:hypothetical protein [Rhodanobacter sp.]
MKACLLLLTLALAACTSAPINPRAPISTTTLARYHWQLRDAVDGHNQRLDALFGNTEKPLQLDFSADRVGVLNACNR